MNVILPNGKEIKNIPDGVSPEQIQELAISKGLATPEDFGLGRSSTPDAAAETLATMVTGAVAMPVSGIAGIAQSLNPFADPGAGAKAVESVQQALTYQPAIPEAQQTLQSIGETVQPVSEAFEAAEQGLGGGALEATGSPTAATAAHLIPTVLTELATLGAGKYAKSLKRLSKSRKADVNRQMANISAEIENRGIVAENLTPEALEQLSKNLPAVIDGRRNIKQAVDDIMGAQIASGANDAKLAGFKAIKDSGGSFRLEPDRLAREVVRQGYEEGFVQSMKSASPDTKKLMRKMNTNMKRIKSDSTLSNQLRPSNTVGDVVADRIKVIRDTADTARKKLNDIVKDRFAGKQVNARPIVEQFRKSLDELGVKPVKTEEGGLSFDYSDSLIEADKGSQRLINSSFQLMNKNKPIDALMVHEFKKKLDALIDFNKVSKGGIPESGRRVLKELRASANDSIRKVDSGYAKVNDTLSESIDALNDFQDLIGKRIKLFEPGANKAIGQDMRALLSNQKRRVALEESLKGIDDLAKKYGYKGKDDVEQLVRMANRLDRRFGAVAETSFQGNIESALNSAVRQMASGDVQGAAINTAIDKAASMASKFRNIDDANAFKSVDDLLKR
jgi:hypothetical protein